MALSDLIGILQFDYDKAEYWGNKLAGGLYNAGTYLIDADTNRAGQVLQACQDYCQYFVDGITTNWSPYEDVMIEALTWIDDNWPDVGDPYELTMEDMLITMLAATPYELNYFIGIVDAYRQSIWNKPFNEAFFAALARGFE